VQQQQQQQQQQQAEPAAAAEPEAAERLQEVAANEAEQRAVPEAPPAFQPAPEDYARAERLRDALVQQTEGLVLDNLESMHAKLSRCEHGSEQADRQAGRRQHHVQ